MTKTYNIDSPKTAFLLVGPPGCGKSTFANEFFAEHEIWGLDKCRKLLLGVLEFPKTVDEPANQLLNAALAAQIAGETTVCVDQTNLNLDRIRETRNKFRDAGYKTVLVLTKPVATDVLIDRVYWREAETGVHIPEFVVRSMNRNYQELLDNDRLKGLCDVEIDNTYEITRGVNLTYTVDHAVFVGDLHGQFDKIRKTLKTYGLLCEDNGNVIIEGYMGNVKPPFFVFVGDLVDRGDQNIEVVRCVKSLVDAKMAVCVQGNHDLAVGRLMREYIGGKKNMRGQSPQSIKTAEEFTRILSESEFASVATFLSELPPVVQVTVGTETYIVSHAGVPIRDGRAEGSELLPTRHDNIYIVKGYKTGEKDEEGRFAVTPIHGIGRTAQYKSQVYGHLNQSEAITGTFQAPWVQDFGNGVKLVAVESSVERTPEGIVGIYEVKNPHV